MVLGSCVISTGSGFERIEPESVAISGKQHGLIVDFVACQTFKHAQELPQEVSYIVPNNSKICMYDTVFRIGDEVIHPQITERGEAQRIYVEATQEGRAALLANNLGNGLVEFKLGNIPRDTI